MGLDVDYIAAELSLDKLRKLVDNKEHGERGPISDEIEVFVDKMVLKHGESKAEKLKRKAANWDLEDRPM